MVVIEVADVSGAVLGLDAEVRAVVLAFALLGFRIGDGELPSYRINDRGVIGGGTMTPMR